MAKYKFKGLFNYYQQVFELYTHACCQDEAWSNFITQLSKRIRVGIPTLQCYFDGSIDNYSITRVIEKKMKEE